MITILSALVYLLSFRVGSHTSLELELIEAWTRWLKQFLDRLGHHYLSSARAVERVLVRTAKANRRARP
jgi:hypothetical protein